MHVNPLTPRVSTKETGNLEPLMPFSHRREGELQHEN